MTIDVEELVVHRGSTVAVEGVSFEVPAGSITTLLGPNGAGKTTLLETLQGRHEPRAGRVRVLGLDPLTDRRTLSTRWGVMPQDGGFPMGTTVEESVRLFARLHHTRRPVDDIVSATGLDAMATRRWRRLSGGEQQRLNLALALCGGSDVLMLDEPTAAVDAAGRELILDLLRARASEGAAVLVTTHRFDDVERLADDVVIIHHGRPRARGSIETVTAADDRIEFRAPPGLDLADLEAVLAAASARTEPSIPCRELVAGSYRVDGPPRPELVAAIGSWLAAQGLVAESMLAGRRTLESVFLELTDGRGAESTGSAP